MSAVTEPTVADLQAKLELANRRLAAASQRFTEEIGPIIRVAKAQAWTACSIAHAEFAVEGDAAVLDNPYEEQE